LSDQEPRLRLALAGNANVGKSVIFNQLTGLSQVIGNWPGKTVERAMGTLYFQGRKLEIIDLPGIYSLSTYSEEELVSRQYIAEEKPDAVINVLDATVLERNLFFTTQLMELQAPLVVALNMHDLAASRGIKIDIGRLSSELGAPVVPTVAVKRSGLTELLKSAIDTAESPGGGKPKQLEYGPEVEGRIRELTEFLESPGREWAYPTRWLAIKLLEGDEEIRTMVGEPGALSEASRLAGELEAIHGEPATTVLSSERYALAQRIAAACQRFDKPTKRSFATRFDSLTTHGFWGYAFMFLITMAVFFTIFTLGDRFSGLIESGLDLIRPILEDVFGTGPLGSIINEGLIEGFFAGVAIALPYIMPFYLILSILEDSGYLARIAFLMDSLMHRMGLHGKAFIPMLLGYGCSVPAVLGCRIMETHRERLIAAFVSTMIPCTARTIVILALVGSFLGPLYALSLYVVNLVIIFILGRVAYRTIPGEAIGLIMEMPSYKKPSWNVVLKQTWFRLSGFIKMALPIIAAAGVLIKILELLGALDVISDLMSPVTVGLLGLPAAVGVLFIVGILRKELTVLMLAALLGTTKFDLVLTPVQMYVFAFVVMFYIPCVATIAALVQEFGWKRATYVTIFEILFATLAGGLLYRLLLLIGWS
jgi:ferrous iron transport protein B